MDLGKTPIPAKQDHAQGPWVMSKSFMTMIIRMVEEHIEDTHRHTDTQKNMGIL